MRSCPARSGGTPAGIPLGIRFLCEACAEESVIALPVVRTRYQLVDCPYCSSSYLLRIDAGETFAPAEGAGERVV